MLYRDARDLIHSGDVIFQSHRRLRSWYDLKIALVRAFTRSEWSHVGMAWVIAGRVFILEAVSAGVRIFPLSRAGDFTLVPGLGLTDDQEEYALSVVGEPYSQIDAVLAFFGRSDAKNRRWFCSEYVCAVMGLQIDKQTPAEVYHHLVEIEQHDARFVRNP